MNDTYKSTARPLDPTRNAEDFIGDATGMTGITTGSAKTTSASPTDTQKDEARGDSINPAIGNPPGDQAAKEAVSDKAYDKSIARTMSSTYARLANERASETDEIHMDENELMELVNDHDNEESNMNDASFKNFSSQGEQSVSGTTPDPESDDDTLENAQQMGQQLGETEQEPLELDIARDVDNAEEYIRTH